MLNGCEKQCHSRDTRNAINAKRQSQREDAYLMPNNKPVVLCSHGSSTPLWSIPCASLVSLILDSPQIGLFFGLLPNTRVIVPSVRTPNRHTRVILPLVRLHCIISTSKPMFCHLPRLINGMLRFFGHFLVCLGWRFVHLDFLGCQWLCRRICGLIWNFDVDVFEVIVVVWGRGLLIRGWGGVWPLGCRFRGSRSAFGWHFHRVF